MSGTFVYMLRSKKGILTTILFSAAVMAIAALVLSYPGIKYYIEMTTNPTVEFLKLKEEDPWLTENCFRYRDCVIPELWALAAAGLWYLFVCANIFRFGTANGASRKSVMTATIVGIPLTAGLVTAAVQLICAGLRATPFFYEDLIYTRLFSLNWDYTAIERGNVPTVATLFPSLEMRDSILYFLAAVTVLSAVCCLYGLFRKHGKLGAVCGTLVMTIIFSLVYLITNSGGTLGKSFKGFFLKNEKIIYVHNDTYYYFSQPKALSFIIAVTVFAAAAIGVYVLSIRRVSIKADGE